MRVGVPAETKPGERRVALTPAGARELTRRGHGVIVQTGAGEGSGFHDGDYLAQGACIADTVHGVFADGELIVKVKEPQPDELPLLREDHLLFTYLHLAAAPDLIAGLCATGSTCIGYETVQDADGRLPLLAPMSEIAGRLATQVAAGVLTAPEGGRGALLGGAPGAPPARVAILGGGVAGTNAARIALGMGADVTIFDTSVPRLRELDLLFDGRARTAFSTSLTIEHALVGADVVIGAALVRAARAPHLVTREHLEGMRRGSVLVDVSIDQGGCFATSRPTTHDHPTFVVDGVVHYCVTNMPAAVPVTATPALTNATLPFVLALADGGPALLEEDHRLRAGVNVMAGEPVLPELLEPAVHSAR